VSDPTGISCQLSAKITRKFVLSQVPKCEGPGAPTFVVSEWHEKQKQVPIRLASSGGLAGRRYDEAGA